MAETMPSTPHRHPVATVFGWVFAVISTALTALSVANAAWVISEWSTYEGGEQTSALVMVGIYTIAALISWAITVVIFRSRRN